MTTKAKPIIDPITLDLINKLKAIQDTVIKICFHIFTI